MATTKIEQTIRRPVPTDATIETSIRASELRSDAPLEALAHPIVDNQEATCTQHPFAALLGTFTSLTWEEIRQEIAREHQQEDIAASQP